MYLGIIQQIKESQRLTKDNFCGDLRISRGLYTFNAQAKAFATVCINSHQNIVNYSFTQSTNMNSPFLCIVIIQRLSELFQIHGLLTMKLEMYGELTLLENETSCDPTIAHCIGVGLGELFLRITR